MIKSKNMNIYGVKVNRVQLIGMVILILGLIAGLILLKNNQIFKSKAAAESIWQNIGITGVENCTPDNAATKTCDATGDRVEINVGSLRNLEVPK